MKAWKRKLSMMMSVLMLAGTLGNSGFTVMAADDEGSLRLAEGEEWASDDEDEAVPPEQEVTEEEEDAVGDEADESVSEDVTAEETASENDEDEAEPEAGEGEGNDDAEAAEGEWKWDEEIESDDRGNPVSIKKVTAKLSIGGKEYEAEVQQGEETRAMDCIWPAFYKFSAKVNIDGKDYSAENECAFGPIPSGHELDIEWKLNDEDAAYPYYYPDWNKKLHCAVCDQDVYIIEDRVELVEGNDRPACDHEVTCRLGMRYFLSTVDGEEGDIRPFFAESGELTLPATGIHSFMKLNDTPWWDWHYDEESEKWSAEAVFWCGDEERDVRYGEDSEEVTLTSTAADNITTYTAVFKSDKFYNTLTHKADRSVEFVTTKKVTDNNFEISGVEDKLYTGKPVTFENLWVRLNGRDMQEGVDYTVKYANNKNAGEASLTVSGKGRFKGSVTLKFNILPVDISTEDFNIHDVAVIANGKVQKKASTLYWNGAPLAKSNYTIDYDDTSAGAYKEPGVYRATVKAKNTNFKGNRTYEIGIMDPGSGDDKLIPVSKLKLSIDPSYFKANPWGDIDWDVFHEQDENGNLKAYKVTYNNIDVTGAFHEHYLDIDSNSGKAVLTVVTNPMQWVEIKDKKGVTSTVHFGGTISKNVNLIRSDISKLKFNVPAEIKFNGHTLNKWELRDFYGFEIVDENYYERNEEGEKVKKPLVLNMGDQYDVSLKNNAKAGKMKVIITGQRGYTGKVTKTINIAKVDLDALKKNGLNDFEKEGSLLAGHWWYDDEEDTDHFDMPEVLEFSKGGAVVDNLQVGYRAVNVWYEGETEHKDYYDFWLDPKTDYTVKYNYASKAPKAGEKAELVISGKGNYTGSVTFKFDVTERNIWATYAEAQSVQLGKKPAATMKPYLAKVTITDIDNGKVLQVNKDYTVEYYRPTFDDDGNLKEGSEWIRFDAKTKWSDVFKAGDEKLEKNGHSLIAKVKAVEGSGYEGDRDIWYNLTKSTIKKGEFKLKDQPLGINPWGDADNWMYFMQDEVPVDIRDYLSECSDEEFKAWADRFFTKYPADCRFYPDIETIKNADKPGMASVTIRVLDDWEHDSNKGCRGGYVTVKFRVSNKDVVK